MKNYLGVFITFCCLTLFTACQKDAVPTSDELLVEEIMNSNAKIELTTSDLPATITEQIEEEYFETYIDEAYLVEDKGYELVLASGETTYYSKTGAKLKRLRRAFCRADKIDVNTLPATIAGYLATNYPSDAIRGAKQLNNGSYFVGLMSKTIVVFDANGVFVKEVQLLHHPCRGFDRLGDRIPLAALPASIKMYIATNYPNATPRLAFTKGGKFLVILTQNGNRLALGFDGNGNLLFIKV